MYINTLPDGFDIYREGQRVGATPQQFNEPIGSHFKAVLKHNGFKDKEIDFWVNDHGDHGNEYLYTPEKNNIR